MKIAVGLSGGVDSSVAAALLREQGHEVVGITMKLWREGRYRGGEKDACFGPGEAEDIARAEKLCRQLGIEYRVFDCSEEYEKVVLDYFRSEYLAGNTGGFGRMAESFLAVCFLRGSNRAVFRVVWLYRYSDCFADLAEYECCGADHGGGNEWNAGWPA